MNDKRFYVDYGRKTICHSLNSLSPVAKEMYVS